MALKSGEIRELNQYEILAEWYLILYKRCLALDMMDKASADNQIVVLKKHLAKLESEMQLLLKEIKRRDLSLESKQLWKPKFPSQSLN